MSSDGSRVRAFDPVAMPRFRRQSGFRGVEFADDAYDAARGADAVAIVTEWNEFRGGRDEARRGRARTGPRRNGAIVVERRMIEGVNA